MRILDGFLNPTGILCGVGLENELGHEVFEACKASLESHNCAP